jgi:hypothetical protein
MSICKKQSKTFKMQSKLVKCRVVDVICEKARATLVGFDLDQYTSFCHPFRSAR